MNSTTSSQKPLQKSSRDFDRDILLNFLLGGLGIAGAAGLTTSYFNHLNNLQRQAARRNPKRVLEINRPGIERKPDKEDDAVTKSGAEKEATWSRGIGLTGGLLGGLGLYSLIRQWSQYQKALDHSQRLQQAQSHYIKTISGESDSEESDSEDTKKKASGSRSLNLYDILLGFGFATPMLLALAGGVGTHKFLDSRYPASQDPEDKLPQFKLRRRSPTLTGALRGAATTSKKDSPEDEDTQDRDKTASMCELMLHTIRGDAKRASAGQWDLLFKAAALGYGDELRKGFTGGKSEDRLDGMFAAAERCVEGVKTANVTEDKTHLGVYWLSRDPVLAPSLSILAASECRDMNREFSKIASNLPDDIQDELMGLGATCMTLMRRKHIESVVTSLPDDVVKCAYDVTDLVSRALKHVAEADKGTEGLEEHNPPRAQPGPSPKKPAKTGQDPVDVFFA